MSGRSFRSVFMVATVAVAALGCYLVSLRVAAERAGARGRRDARSFLPSATSARCRPRSARAAGSTQLERWNVKVLALSAPKADQFVNGGYQLARLARPSDQVDMTAPVVLAAAPQPVAAPPASDDDADDCRKRSRGDDAVPCRRRATREVPASLMQVPQATPVRGQAGSGTPPADAGKAGARRRQACFGRRPRPRKSTAARNRWISPLLPGKAHEPRRSHRRSDPGAASADALQGKSHAD